MKATKLNVLFAFCVSFLFAALFYSCEKECATERKPCQ